MSEWISVKDLAAFENCSFYSIEKAFQRGRYTKKRQVDGRGRGGKVWQIHINDPAISAEALRKIRQENGIDNRLTTKPSLPVPAGITGQEPHPTPAPTSPRLANLASQSTPCISEKAKRIALARMDLLRIWQEYRNRGHVKATAADQDFENAYNNKIIFKEIYEILGTVSIKTLYRWQSDLDGTSDWSRLVPQHFNRNNGISRLSENESKVFMGFLLQPNKIKIGTAVRLTRFYLEKKGVPTEKSHMTFRRYADGFKKNHFDRWVLMREGQKALRDKVEPYIKRDSSLLEVGDVLVADGHRLNFQVINPFTGKPCRAVLVGYLDWKSYDLVGYEIMIEENTQCIAAALRNSIMRLGKMPRITYQDNGKAFRARFFTRTESFEEAGIHGLFGKLGIIPVFAQPYNARAKVIERWFRDFSDTFERLIPSFIGTSIQDKPAYMMRNEKFHKAIHNEYIPTIEETIQLIEAWLEFHRSQPCPHVKGKTIGQVFEAGRGAGIDAEELNDLMMSVQKTRIDRNGIRFLSADYYDDNLYGLREAVLVKYSLFDLSHVKVYRLNGGYLCRAKRVMPVNPMAKYLGEVKDVDALKHRLALQRRLEKSTVQGVKELIKIGKPVVLDWQKAAEKAPRLIEKLDDAGVDLPAEERRIPEEVVRGTQTNEEPQELHVQQFDEMYQRYEHLLKHGDHSVEDKRWLDEYMVTDEYKLIYETGAATG